MNFQLLQQYIEAYKLNFEYINNEELYKWKAVKCFKDHWDIEAEDFPNMLKSSVKKTVNLLKSGQYFPLRMIVSYAEREPERVRQIFKALYNEDVDIYKRIIDFKDEVKAINDEYFPGKNTYQDHRAILVYLSLRFPERYFLYKFEMYKNFAVKLNLTYKPLGGRIENIGHFSTICSLIKYYLSQDQELLKLHKNRITDDCYYDENLHILTQDFIYAVSQHLGRLQSTIVESLISIGFPLMNTGELETADETINFSGRFVNFIDNGIEAKRIGDLGEIWVLNQEKAKLIKAGLPEYANKIRHISNEIGDGAGYDIESYDVHRNKIFIEVKTTKHDKNCTFYISRNELERSKIEDTNFYLYRVYNFNETTNEAECLIIHGNLTPLCNVPISYKVNLKTV